MSIIEEFKASALKNRLIKDMKGRDVKGRVVFPSFRNGGKRIDFYYGGGKLFGFKDELFATHIKYVPAVGLKKDYVVEGDLKPENMVTSFVAGYDRIKENCWMFSKIEADFISYLFRNSSYVFSEDRFVLLDIELSLRAIGSSVDEMGKQETADGDDDSDRLMDRIDIVVYDRIKRVLHFVEAKHFSNSELWGMDSGKAKVVGQIRRYERQAVEKKTEILAWYSKYIDYANNLFHLSPPLEAPKEIDNKVTLFVFGFDGSQKALWSGLRDSGRLDGIFVKAIGDCHGRTFTTKNIIENRKPASRAT